MKERLGNSLATKPKGWESKKSTGKRSNMRMGSLNAVVNTGARRYGLPPGASQRRM